MEGERRPPFVEQVRSRHPGARVVVGFADEMRFGQQGTLTRVWARRGSRPRAVRQAEHLSAHLFGASIPELGRGAALVLPRCDTASMNLFLAEVSGRLEADCHLVLIVDNAGWHKSSGLRVPPNVSLLHQPPYSPEVNGQENVWGHLRCNYLANREYADYDAILSAGCEAWNALTPDNFRTLAHRSYLITRN